MCCNYRVCRTKNSEGVKKEIANGRKTTQIFVNNLYIQKHIKFVSISKKLDFFCICWPNFDYKKSLNSLNFNYKLLYHIIFLYKVSSNVRFIVLMSVCSEDL